MTGRFAFDVQALDPVSRAGLITQLRDQPELELVAPGGPRTAQVDHTVDDAALQTVRALRRPGSGRVVLVATALDDQALLTRSRPAARPGRRPAALHAAVTRPDLQPA